MKIRTLAIVPAAMLIVALVPASAYADTVGVPGTPSCFGERVSHGSSDHQLTPKERAAVLQTFVDAGDPDALEIFGSGTVTAGDFAKFVRVNCSDNPYF